MASKMKQGQSVYIPFIDGESVLDSQNRPRMYKTVEQFQKSYPGIHFENPDLQEYAPVVRCRECIYMEKSKSDITVFCKGFARDMLQNDFCSYGERRE